MPFYYNVMTEIYKDEISKASHADKNKSTFAPLHEGHMSTAEIKQRMMSNNAEMDQNADAAYHLNRELMNQDKFNSGIQFQEIKQSDQV